MSTRSVTIERVAGKATMSGQESAGGPLSLKVSGYIPASPAQVFRAWTTPSELRKWWGPENVRCLSADIDLRIGGEYRIANELPDKSILWISGVFEQIENPTLLVYTWSTGSGTVGAEKVTVRFRPSGKGTEVEVRHERIETARLRDQHRQGWRGCLHGLAEHLERPASS